jgi:hypothetical protein
VCSLSSLPIIPNSRLSIHVRVLSIPRSNKPASLTMHLGKRAETAEALPELAPSASLISVLADWVDYGCAETAAGLKKGHDRLGQQWPVLIVGSAVAVRVALWPLRLRAAVNAKLMALTTEHCNQHAAPGLKAHFRQGAAGTNAEPQYRAAITAEWHRVARVVGASPWKALTPLGGSIPLFLATSGAWRRLALDNQIGGLLAISQPFTALPAFLFNFALIEATRRERAKPISASSPASASASSSTSASASSSQSLSRIRKQLPFFLSHSANLLALALLSQMPAAVNLFVAVSSCTSLLEMFASKWIKFAWIDTLARRIFAHRIQGLAPSAISLDPSNPNTAS